MKGSWKFAHAGRPLRRPLPLSSRPPTRHPTPLKHAGSNSTVDLDAGPVFRDRRRSCLEVFQARRLDGEGEDGRSRDDYRLSRDRVAEAVTTLSAGSVVLASWVPNPAVRVQPRGHVLPALTPGGSSSARSRTARALTFTYVPGAENAWEKGLAPVQHRRAELDIRMGRDRHLRLPGGRQSSSGRR